MLLDSLHISVSQTLLPNVLSFSLSPGLLNHLESCPLNVVIYNLIYNLQLVSALNVDPEVSLSQSASVLCNRVARSI